MNAAHLHPFLVRLCDLRASAVNNLRMNVFLLSTVLGDHGARIEVAGD